MNLFYFLHYGHIELAYSFIVIGELFIHARFIDEIGKVPHKQRIHFPFPLEKVPEGRMRSGEKPTVDDQKEIFRERSKCETRH